LIERLGTGQTLFLVLAVYFLANVAVRLIMPHGLELDEAEQVYLSQWFLPGYGAQPPLYNWLQHGALAVFGMSLATLAGLKGLMLFLSYLFYYLAARQVMADKRLAVIAALGLLTIPQVSFEAQRDLSHTVAAIFGASLFLYALVRVLSAPSLFAFLLFGAATGIGGITKYNFAILPVAAGLAVLMDRDMRRTMLSWRILPAALLALVIVAPHALWLMGNFEDASKRTLQKLAGEDASVFEAIGDGLGSLSLGVLSFLGITIVILGLVYQQHLKTILKANSRWTRLVGRTLVLSIALIVLMVLFAGFENVRDRWLTPILLAAPLYFALKVDAAKVPIEAGLKRLWIVALIIMVIIPSALALRANMGRVKGDYTYVNIPFGALARTVAEKSAGANTIIVASDGQLAGNMLFSLPNLPVTTSPPPATMQSRPLAGFDRAVFIWRRKDGVIPKDFQDAFGPYLQSQGIGTAPSDLAIVGYPYQWGRPTDQYHFAYAVIDLRK
jgi:4-amino-4-deoxy-L-arabinose transferase-like glycosyltransferase